MATFAPSILVIVHSFLGYSDCSPIGPLIGQGIAYSIFAAVIWPCIPLVVPENLVGLAYGALFSIQSAGLAVFPLLIAFIYTDSDKHYIPTVELFFILVAMIGVFVGVFLNYHDYFHINSKLNDPSYRVSTGDDNDDENDDCDDDGGNDGDGGDRHGGIKDQATNSYALMNPLLQDNSTDNDRLCLKRDK